MKIKYFEDTDTLYIELKSNEVAETRHYDNATIDMDTLGNICGITIEDGKDTLIFQRFLMNKSPLRVIDQTFYKE
jgi:uncharacterized protein YuzE